MLKYSLQENILTEQTSEYIALTIASETYYKADLVKIMHQKCDLISIDEIETFMNILEESIKHVLECGGNINLPFINTSFLISGVFYGPDDEFDSHRHSIDLCLNKGTLVHEIEKDTTTKKIDYCSPTPNIFDVKDIISNKINDVLTPNGVLQIWGFDIQIAGNDLQNGVWFVPEMGAPIKCEHLFMNTSKSIIAIIPNLSPGNYILRIVTQYVNGSILKKPRCLFLNKGLSVL